MNWKARQKAGMKLEVLVQSIHSGGFLVNTQSCSPATIILSQLP